MSRDTQAECPDLLVIPHCLGHAPWFPTSDAHFTYEALLMACSLYPDDVRRMFDHWGESALLRFEAVAQAMVDHDLPRLIWIGQDICDAKGPVLSPDLLRRLYFPQIARAIEPLKQRGVRIVWHADANYRLILDDLIALGIDGFQGFYETPAGIRLEDLARRTNREGQPLLLFGSVATVWVLPHGSVANVEREVERNLNVDAGRGGLLLAPTSSIGPEVPAENVFAMYRHALEYRPGTGAAQP